MSELCPEVIVDKLFKRIRNDFKLGMREYLAAISIIQDDLDSQDLPELRVTLELLWCHSLEEQQRFGEIWKKVIPQGSSSFVKTVQEKSSGLESTENLPEVPPADRPTSPPPISTTVEPESDFSLAPLPVRAPILPLEIDNSSELEAYWPVSRRSMGYLWRYLRRPAADGPRDVLDLRATVEQAAQRGIFLGPVYRRREVNHAHLMLFIDQAGSMTPVHRFTRDLVETAREDSSVEQLGVYYFYNVPGTYVYEDSALTQPVEVSQVLSHCDRDTSVLVVSDAGAARGQRHMSRFRDTTQFIAQIKRHTRLVGWLNPMPVSRWANTTADMIARLVPMAQMNDDGFSNVIDVIRGQPFSGWHQGGTR